MKQILRRFLSLALSVLMVCSVLPVTALAEENNGLMPLLKLSENDESEERQAEEIFEPDDEINYAEAEKNEVVAETNAAENGAATFSVGGTTYADFSEALSAAENGTDKTVVVASNGSISGEYTIPAGVTLLVPFDDANTLYTTSPDVVETVANQIAYRTLTLDSNTSITVCGAISVGGKLFTSRNSHVCKPTGAYGQIQMNVGSQITVENGGELYAWGYITGSGNVHITSGATVYECFQVTDWRGGSATMKFGTPADVKKVFPFSQYYVQNIEAPLTIEYGGAEKAYIAAYGENIAIGFVGAGGMFELADGATFTKTYDPTTDRIIFDISGNASLKGIKIKVLFATIDSANYVLPINNNVNINIHSGVTTISQDAALLPGVKVAIDNGAELKIQSGANLYVYDADEWSKNYVWGSGEDGISPVAYSPSGKGSRTISDAAIDINGTLNVEGSVYTTTGGADIYSSKGTGRYVQTKAPGTESNTYQCTQSGSGFLGTKITPVEIRITAAKLHNADGSYTETATARADDVFYYVNGKWVSEIPTAITITYNKNDGTENPETYAQVVEDPNGEYTLEKNRFVRDGYKFICWNTAADGNGTDYGDEVQIEESNKISLDTTLYAIWMEESDVVITFNSNGGEGTMSEQAIKPNVAWALDKNTFTRADYDFVGWNTAADGSGTVYADGAAITISENTTLYAQWTLHKYHVRWLNLNGAVLKEGYYTCEENAGYDMWFEEDPEPRMPEDENYTYKFLNRWTPYDETKGINGWGFNPHEDVDFTAVYNKFEKLTVTFNANGGIGTMDSVKIANGGSGEYYMLPECGFTREGYTFNGWLITGMVKMSEWDDGEELNDELWGRSELLALSDLTLKASWKHSDGWFTDNNGKQYYKDGELQKTGWTVIDGNTYYLNTETGYAATGITTLVPNGATEAARCVFDAEGVFQSSVIGVYSVGEDTYWLNSGIIEEEAGLKRVVKEDGEVNYYYFAVQKNLDEREGLTLSAAVKSTAMNGKDCWLHKTNGLALPEWGYYFDENGIILHDEDTGKNGILSDGEDLCYYVDGVKAPAGMIKIGDDYYYANSKGKLIVSETYYCSRMNGLMEEGTYAFDAEGKLIPGATDKNGIVRDEDGVLRYYVYGKVTYVGLIEIDGDFYYVRSNGEVIADCVYWITWTHGLKEAGNYIFGTDGKLIGVPKEGMVEEDGVMHYYVKGELTYAGLIQIDGDYYYVNSKCEVVRNCDYYITWTHDLLPQGKYHFDADGKLTGEVAPLKNGIYEEDGSLYFYRNGERAYAGLIQIDGDYYYVRSTCEVVHDRSYYVYWTHGLMPEGYYSFDSAGRMILNG